MISPPRERRYEARASARFWDPPRTIGQPTAWPASPRTSPTAEVAQYSSGRIEWAARPAIRALAGSSTNQLAASRVAGWIARSPNRAARIGCRGGFSGPMRSAKRASARADERPHQPTVGAASRPSDRPCRSIDRSSTAVRAVVERMGQRGRGVDSSRPCSARGSDFRNGDATAKGWTAEQTSCRKPGQGQGRRPGAAADRRGRLDHQDREALPCQGDGRGQAVRARADHDARRIAADRSAWACDS